MKNVLLFCTEHSFQFEVALPCMVDGIDCDANSWNKATRCCRLVQYCCSTFSACLSKHMPDQSYKVTPKEIENA